MLGYSVGLLMQTGSFVADPKLTGVSTAGHGAEPLPKKLGQLLSTVATIFLALASWRFAFVTFPRPWTWLSLPVSWRLTSPMTRRWFAVVPLIALPVGPIFPLCIFGILGRLGSRIVFVSCCPMCFARWAKFHILLVEPGAACTTPGETLVGVCHGLVNLLQKLPISRMVDCQLLIKQS